MELADIHPARLVTGDNYLGILRRVTDDWPRHRANFCTGFDPEQFLSEIHGYGWSPGMIDELEIEVRRRVTADPEVPMVEHMLDAAIKVRYGGEHDLSEL